MPFQHGNRAKLSVAPERCVLLRLSRCTKSLLLDYVKNVAGCFCSAPGLGKFKCSSGRSYTLHF